MTAFPPQVSWWRGDVPGRVVEGDAELPPEGGRHGADCLFFPTDRSLAHLMAESDPTHVRLLTESDSAAFARFEAGASEADRDEAFVALDHWAVVGAFDDGGRGDLVAVASAYPFRDSRLADIGVLVLPGHRRQGHAVAVVRALAREAARREHLPQYRCQHGHRASRAVAVAAGFTLYGYWDYPEPAAH